MKRTGTFQRSNDPNPTSKSTKEWFQKGRSELPKMLELFCKKEKREEAKGRRLFNLTAARKEEPPVCVNRTSPASAVSSQFVAFQKHCLLIRTANVPVIFPAAKQVLKHCMVPFRRSLRQGYEGLGVVFCAVE
ncbi:hypothetical protein SRHO_G00331790 [Serrasalmus rhombeus]